MNDNWGLQPDLMSMENIIEEPEKKKPKKKVQKEKRTGRKRRGYNVVIGFIKDWWNKEPEEEEEEEVKPSIVDEQERMELRQQAEDEAAKRKEDDISISAEYREHNAVTLTINKQLDPYDEIEISLHVVPLDIATGDNISLVQPSFKFTMVEPDELSEESDLVYQGVGTNLPDRIFIMNNRDYNLGVANHADKWAVFWLFTVCVSCFPRCLMR